MRSPTVERYQVDVMYAFDGGTLELDELSIIGSAQVCVLRCDLIPGRDLTGFLETCRPVGGS